MLKKLMIFCLLLTPLFLNAEQTLAMIKPDAVAAGHIGAITSRYEKNGLRIAAMKMTKLSKEQAAAFYAAHKSAPFIPSWLPS